MIFNRVCQVKPGHVAKVMEYGPKFMELAKKMNIKTFGFLGAGGGKVLKLCDEVFLVPSESL